MDPDLSLINDYILRCSLGDLSEFKQVFVPGRVEILGKHTDYAGGSSIVTALSKGIHFAYRPRQDSRIEVHAVDYDSAVHLDHDETIVEDGHWSAYFLQVVKRVYKNFPDRNIGATIIVSSSLPPAAGMSSSSAVIVGAFACLADVNNSYEHPAFRSNITSRLELADYLSTVENGGSFRSLSGSTGVGTLGGSEDHTAILASRRDHLGWFSYRPTLERQYLPFPDDMRMAIISSGVTAEKSGAARSDYNRAAILCQEITSLWNSARNSHAANPGEILRDIDFSISSVRKILTEKNRPDLASRFEHFFREEAQHIPDFASALQSGDYPGMASAIFNSFADADHLLMNQVEETRSLVHLAKELGALGASAFGAGFGGSVYALVPAAGADKFLNEWRHAYVDAFPGHANMVRAFVDRPAAGVSLPVSL